MKISDFYGELEKRYPESLSCEWDNDGIMCSVGDILDIEKVLVALDPTEDVINYAAENGFDTVLTHHPMIFKKLGAVTPGSNVGRKIIFALMNNISVISLHTRLDAGEGGVNDALAQALELCEVETFGDSECPTIGRIGELSKPMSGSEFAQFVKEKLGAPSVEFVSADDEDTLSKVAVVGGAGKDFIYPAKAAGADVLVTGEASYNALLDAAEDDISVVTAGHFFTENVVCEKLKALVKEILPEAEIEVYFSNTIRNI